MASNSITLLFTLLMLKSIEMRQQPKKEKDGLWDVRQVVPLPAEEVVIFIDPEVHPAEQLTTTEEVADEEEKQDRVVFVAKTSKREKTTTLPIVVGVVGGVVFLLLSLLIVLCLRLIRLKSPNFSREIAHLNI